MRWRYQVTFRGTASNWAGVLDMLRYDQARIMDWAQTRDDPGMRDPRWAITFTTEREATMDRWASFALNPRLEARYDRAG